MTRYLFTTLPTNDLGLLTRSLPIARELSTHGHEIVFCSPAQAPSQLIAEAGFENILPRHPLYDLISTDQSLKGLVKFIASGKHRERYGNLFRFLSKLIPALPFKSAPATHEVWNMDHASAMMGMLNEGFVRANCESLKEIMVDCGTEVVVDFWNPMAVMAARALRKPLVTVIQANAHPESEGFIWWKPLPADIPTPVPVVNKILADYNLPPINKMGELCLGDLTLAIGTPETDPLPEHVKVTYIGPALWQKEGTKLPGWIDDLEKDKPLVWVYSGNPRYASSNGILDSMIVLSACVSALADEEVQVLLTTGYHSLPEELLPLPDNFRYEPYVPGLVMAERCDLLIHHGGYGSCQTGLYAGKPSIIIPTYSERESNARRIASLGAGIIVPVENASAGKRVNVDVLRETVRHILAGPTFADNAKKISAKMRSYGGASQAASLIEQYSSVTIGSAQQ